MLGSFDTPYPPGRPLVFGTPDGFVQPAVMLARYAGARPGTAVWVEGDGVEAAVGAWIALTAGDVIVAEGVDPVWPAARNHVATPAELERIAEKREAKHEAPAVVAPPAAKPKRQVRKKAESVDDAAPVLIQPRRTRS